jgi:hypothetical protein
VEPSLAIQVFLEALRSAASGDLEIVEDHELWGD